MRKIVNVSASVPAGYHVKRGGEQVIPANHVRRSFSLSREIKRDLSPEDRIELCEALSAHVTDALARWPDDPITVSVLGVTVRLSDHPHPNKSGKVLVRY